MQLTLSLAALGAIALGVVQCFYGYRIFRVILGVIGSILGGLLAGYFVYSLTQSQLVGLIAGVVGGLIGAGLTAGFYVVGVFLVGAYGVVFRRRRCGDRECDCIPMLNQKRQQTGSDISHHP